MGSGSRKRKFVTAGCSVRQAGLNAEDYLRGQAMANSEGGGWPTARFIGYLTELFVQKGFAEAAPIKWDRNWQEQTSKIVTWCATNGVSVSAYARAMADTMASFCHKNGLKFQPRMCFGPAAIQRYKQWREQVHSETADVLQLTSRDVFGGDVAWAEIVAMTGDKALARQAAVERCAEWKPRHSGHCRGVSTVLGRMNGVLPDQLILTSDSPDWVEVFDAAWRLCDQVPPWRR